MNGFSQKIKDRYLALPGTVLFSISKAAYHRPLSLEKCFDRAMRIRLYSQKQLLNHKKPLSKLAYRIGSYQMDHEDDLVSPNLKLFGVLPSQFKAKF